MPHFEQRIADKRWVSGSVGDSESVQYVERILFPALNKKGSYINIRYLNTIQRFEKILKSFFKLNTEEKRKNITKI